MRVQALACGCIKALPHCVLQLHACINHPWCPCNCQLVLMFVQVAKSNALLDLDTGAMLPAVGHAAFELKTGNRERFPKVTALC